MRGRKLFFSGKVQRGNLRNIRVARLPFWEFQCRSLPSKSCCILPNNWKQAPHPDADHSVSHIVLLFLGDFLWIYDNEDSLQESRVLLQFLKQKVRA